MKEAQLECTADNDCQGVYDGGCDSSGPYYLCSLSAQLESSGSSCVYTKHKKGNAVSNDDKHLFLSPLFDAIYCVVIFFDIFLCLECSTNNDCSGGNICQGGYCSKFNP